MPDEPWETLGEIERMFTGATRHFEHDAGGREFSPQHIRYRIAIA